MRILRYVAGILLILIILSLLGLYAFLRSTLPKIDGRVELAGLSEPVEVIRDRWGVPHIFAETKRDLFFSIGYVMAQDRLFQMDFLRRVGSGRLAEILGDDFVEVDHFLRILSVMWPEERIDRMIRGAYREAVEAYAAGVNAFIANHPAALPIEFRILGYEPEPWKPTDGIYINLYMGWNLQAGWNDLTLMKLIDKVGPEMAEEAMPSYPGDGPIITAGGVPDLSRFAETLYPLGRLAEEIPLHPGAVGASNGWVIAGERTTTGMPILCQDPHLDLTVPSIWYELHIHAGDIDAAGVTLPGLPAVLIGNNREIAWGATNVMLDDMDFYIEKINPRDPHQYLFKGQWRDMRVVETVIGVKGGEAVKREILVTRHGPIINDVHKGLKEVLSMRWTLNDGLGALECFMDLNTARNWQEFTRAVRKFHGPGQNVPYADRKGNIGYYACVRIPIRSRPGEGALPMPGWDGRHEWKGYVPFEETPHLLNPKEGFVVVANNKTAPDDYPHYISRYFAAKYRAERIRQLIQATQKLSVADNRAIQNDIYSVEAEEITPILLQAFDETEGLSRETEQALSYLREWDFVTHPKSVATTLFHVIQVKLIENIFKDELGDALYREYIEAANEMHKGFQFIMAEEDSRWFDDVQTTDRREGRDEIIRKSTEQAIAELRQTLDKEMSEWEWGRLHQHLSGHLIFKDAKFLRKFFNIGPFSIGGSRATIAPGAYAFTRPYRATHGASMRQVIDFSNLRESLRVITTGCSGRFNSPFYDNQSELWRQGEYHPILMDREEIEANAAATLTLVPGRGKI